MGAFIAGKVAATHPDRVLSVVYGGQAPLLTGESNGSTEVDAFAKAVESGRDLGEYIMAVSPPDRPKPTPAQASAYAKFIFNGKDLKALAAAGKSFPDLAVKLGDLKRCKAPALFLFGEKDISRDRIRSVQKSLGHGEIKVVMGADHMTTLIKPEFGASLIGFLRANKTK
jgi:pimeloyl-ACP methyl ester carboxylesterase